MRKLFVLITFLFFVATSQAQLGNILGGAVKSSREAKAKKKRDEAIKNSQEEIRIEDSVRIAKAAEARKRQEEWRAKNDAEQNQSDALQKVKEQKEQEAINIELQQSQNIKEWDKLKMDSSTFIEKFGSLFEYKFQQSAMATSRHGWKVCLIGTKASYLNYIILYLAQQHWEFKTKESPTAIKVYATTYNNEQGYDAKLNFQFFLNSKQRITSVTITGTANDVIDFFLKYWENYDLNVNGLKQKKTIYTMNASDKVSFSWTGINPVINVTKGIIDFQFEQNKDRIQ